MEKSPGKLWLTCANDTEFGEDNWVQRYAEATAEAWRVCHDVMERASPQKHNNKKNT